MKKIKTVARVVVYDKNSERILLVRNKGASFWYPPGGTWEWERENILECAKREVFEETGLHVNIGRLIYMQEFHGIEDDVENIFMETFWMGELSHEQALDEHHIDLDPKGAVEEAKWFKKESIQELKVFPKRLKNTFWDNIGSFENNEDPFIGIS
jgi:ADP-ribose pyrophosphatase YjhB (NUDIX family)